MGRCGTCSVISVAVLAAVVYQLSRPQFSAGNLEPSLAGQVAVVTGASRGIGKGFAVGLGEAGATVYITARTLAKRAAKAGMNQMGSLQETCELVVKAGGKCIPVAVDSENDTHLQALFDKVVSETGRIDILVNNAFSAVEHLSKNMGRPFWEKSVETWDVVNKVGLRSHYVASVYAAKHMSKAKRGLIVNVASVGGLSYFADVAYGVGKAGMDRMANDMAIELKTENVTMVSLWPGLVKTENIEESSLGSSEMKERRGLQPGMPQFDIDKLLPSALAETPLLSGRAVAALARDKRKLDYTGRVLTTAAVAYDYGLLDERGVRSPPFTSVKFILGNLLRSTLERHGLFTIPGGCFDPQPGLTDKQRLLWNTLPDLSIPWFLLKLTAGAPNLS